MKIQISGSSNLEAYKSVRKTWGEMNPTTRVVDSKKNYKRKDRNNRRWED